MKYRSFGPKVYIRADKGDELIDCITRVCEEMRISSATFHGIGACGDVTVATYIEEKDDFLDHSRSGLLEMVSLDGNIVTTDDGRYASHAHAMFSYLNEEKGVSFFGGHLKAATVSYTAELVLEPVTGGELGQRKDPITGIDIWKL